MTALDPDLDHVLRLIDVEMRDVTRFHGFIFPGEPKSKTRARVTRNGVYTPSKPNETALAQFLRYSYRSAPFEGNVAVACVFYRPNSQRIDVDNMMKLVMDAATGICWADDDQVTFQVATAELDPQNPRTVIGMSDHQSTLRRGVDALTRHCAFCAEAFTVDHRSRTTRYCSPRCVGDMRRAPKLHPGQGKGPKGQPAGRCQDCGNELAKRSFLRCRECWKIARAKGIG